MVYWCDALARGLHERDLETCGLIVAKAVNCVHEKKGNNAALNVVGELFADQGYDHGISFDQALDEK